MKVFFYLALISILFSCGENPVDIQKAEISSKKITQVRKLNYRKTIQRVELEYLPQILKTNDSVYQAFNSYIAFFNFEIKNEAEIISLLNKRDSLILPIKFEIEKYYDKLEDYTLWEKIDKELKSVGFLPIYAEGQLIGLDIAPIIQKEIDKIASKPLKLWNDFNNSYARTLGGEYQFSNLELFFNTYVFGEKLFSKYPNSEYYSKIKDKFYQIINTITDIHVVSVEGDDFSNCVCFEFFYGFYPYVTNCDDLQNFVDKNPKDLISKVLQKIIENKSEIKVYPENKEKANIYVIAIEKAKSYNKALEKTVNYILKGEDYIHPLSIKINGTIHVYVAYRFYSDKQKAEEMLEKVIDKKPQAKILHVVLYDDYSPAELIN